MNAIKTLCLSMTLAAVSTASVASDSTDLQKKLANMQSLQADFSQKVTDVNDKVIQQGSGTLAMQTPNLLNWHLTAPDESLIVANNDGVWIYNPFAEEVTILDAKEILTASPVALLVSRDEKVWSQYQVAASGDCYKITPIQLDAQVQNVNLCIKGNKLVNLSILDNQGNNSQFELSNQQVLAANNSQQFSFAIPDGVDIDDQRKAVVGGQ
ncbi:MAG: outer membrane lipoprotein chaperone LolA [Shewanella sp.]